MMNKIKEKKYIAPNECSLKRWIAVLVVGLAVGFALSTPFSILAQNQVDTFMGIRYSELFGQLCFVPLFWGMVFAVKVVGKTSLKDFVLGVGGKINKKECLSIMGLYAAGLLIYFLTLAGNIHLRGVNAGEFAFLVLFMLLVAWMQTSWEELIFRGLVIRWACKNKVGFTKKAVIASIVSSLAFALGHSANPEVMSQSGIRIAMAVISYAIPGMICYITNLHFGSLMPGLIIHWVNNFILFTLISAEVTAMPVPTLLVDTTPHTAELMLFGNILTNIPVLVYMILDMRKRRKAATDD